MALPIEELGKKIAARRSGTGIRAAAAEVGVSPATLSRVENGQMPDLETFSKICTWLKIDPGEFLGTKREEHRPPVVIFRKDQAVSPKTAMSLAKAIIATQEALRAKAQLGP